MSHYQGIIDWAKVKAAGIRFAYIKASQGADFRDPQLSANVAGATAQAVPIGLYHVFVANAGIAQIDNWLKVRAAFPAQLPAWLDIEPGALTEDTVHDALAFLGECFAKTDCIYCSPMTAQADLSDPEFQTYPLAIAHYTDAPPPNTVLWSGWEFWQHSCSGIVDGVYGAVDLDWFNGDESDFQKALGLSARATRPLFQGVGFEGWRTDRPSALLGKIRKP